MPNVKPARVLAFRPIIICNTNSRRSFIYEDTPDQLKATQDIKKDMEDEAPMDRLVCGDVGFGKTEVAIRAAFKAVCESKQAAVLVPTTILALQHHKTFAERLKDFPVKSILSTVSKAPNSKKNKPSKILNLVKPIS